VLTAVVLAGVLPRMLRRRDAPKRLWDLRNTHQISAVPWPANTASFDPFAHFEPDGRVVVYFPDGKAFDREVRLVTFCRRENQIATVQFSLNDEAPRVISQRIGVCPRNPLSDGTSGCHRDIRRAVRGFPSAEVQFEMTVRSPSPSKFLTAIGMTNRTGSVLKSGGARPLSSRATRRAQGTKNVRLWLCCRRRHIGGPRIVIALLSGQRPPTIYLRCALLRISERAKREWNCDYKRRTL